MALDNDQIICKLMKDEWAAIKNMINALQHVLSALYNQIKNFLLKLKNNILKRIVQTISEMMKVLIGSMGLNTVSNNLAREKWCQIMYKCKPMIKKLYGLVGEDIFNWIYGPDKIETFDFSEYGIPKQTFTSKYEVYEYVACRLSLRGLLDKASKLMLEGIKEWLENAFQYIDINYWLDRTGVGAMIKRKIKDYEDVFDDYIKPHLMEMDKYIDCAFALCDFKASSKNFLDDFCNRYSIEQTEETIGGVLKRNYKVLRSDMLKSTEEYFAATKQDLAKVGNSASNVSQTNAELLYRIFPEEETNAETSTERDEREYDNTQRDNANTPSLATGFNSKTRRITRELISPNSDVA